MELLVILKYFKDNVLSGTREEEIKRTDKFGIGGLVVMGLAEWLVDGNQLFFDRYFTHSGCMDKLMKLGILSTGTVVRRHIPCPASVPISVYGPRGSYHVDYPTDNKPVTLMSTAFSDNPVDTCRRWSRKAKEYL